MVAATAGLLICLASGCGGRAEPGESLATARRRELWKSADRGYWQGEFYTTFLYSPLWGLGPEDGVSRRDPSTVIQVGDTYYVWYTRTPRRTEPIDYDKNPSMLWTATWYPASIYYATSKNGWAWQEQGEAVTKGPKGTYDDAATVTPEILVANGRYYLYYQASGGAYRWRGTGTIGMSRAESPDGPWHRMERPILTPGDIDPTLGPVSDAGKIQPSDAWDGRQIHDPNVLVKDGKIWLYYKGEPWSRKPDQAATDTRGIAWGLAVADKPEGPFVKSPLNPVTNSGHEVLVWRHREGVAALITTDGFEKNTVQYAPDGVNFEMKAHVAIPPNAGGAFSPDNHTNARNARGIAWGLGHITPTRSNPWPYLIRFDCDLTRDGRGNRRFKQQNQRFTKDAYLSEKNRLKP